MKMSTRKTWRTRAGESTPISQLDDAHLSNAIRYMERRAVIETYVAMIAEAKRRGLKQIFAEV